MTTLAITSFFGIMLALAVMPSASVALVVARSAGFGLRNGIATALGIVVGDLVFVAIAILGMSALAAMMGSLFSVFKYVGGAYLIYLGIKILRSRGSDLTISDNRHSTLVSSFASGFLLTMGDLKAIFFYASLFPTLLDLSTLSVADTAIIVAVTIVTVGGVKTAYAIAAKTITSRFQARSTSTRTQKVAGGLMVGVGSYIIIKA